MESNLDKIFDKWENELLKRLDQWFTDKSKDILDILPEESSFNEDKCCCRDLDAEMVDVYCPTPEELFVSLPSTDYFDEHLDVIPPPCLVVSSVLDCVLMLPSCCITLPDYTQKGICLLQSSSCLCRVMVGTCDGYFNLFWLSEFFMQILGEHSFLYFKITHRKVRSRKK